MGTDWDLLSYEIVGCRDPWKDWPHSVPRWAGPATVSLNVLDAVNHTHTHTHTHTHEPCADRETDTQTDSLGAQTEET